MKHSIVHPLALLIAALPMAGCRSGPSPTPGPAPTAPPSADATPSNGDPAGSPPADTRSDGALVRAACDTMMAVDAEQSCVFRFDEQECLDTFEGTASSPMVPRDAWYTAVTCIEASGSCDEIGGCLTALTIAIEGTQPRTRRCGDQGFSPVSLTAEEAASRHGQAAQRFSEDAFDKEHPVEVCGAMAQIEWLMTVTCDDGSAPFSDPRTAHASRVDAVGSGGRCGSIIDLYRVPCPEGDYEIHMDMYMCGPDDHGFD